MIVLERADVEAFRETIAQRAGLRFDDDRLPHLEALLAARLQATRASDVRSYLAGLAGAELGVLMPALSVPETYFLRNAPHFDRAAQLMRARAGREIRMLSAGCASGEEAYSLAIIARENLSASDLQRVSIVGVDLNPEAIDRAREGRYTQWSLRQTKPAVAMRWFETDARGHTLIAAVRSMVQWELVNLVDPPAALFEPESYHLAFCRNVLMYLTPAAAQKVLAHLWRALTPGGLLFVGHAENLRGLSTAFHLRQASEAFFYEKREDRRAPATEPGDHWQEVIARSSQRIEALSRAPIPRPEPAAEDPFEPVRSLMKAERFQEALGTLATIAIGGANPSGDPDALLLRAALLVTTGDAATAESTCAELLALDELNAGAHYVMALCREHAGDFEGAREHDLTASYLDPGFAMPHLHRGILARRAGDQMTARRELETALSLLAREDASRIVLFGGGFARDGLIQLCRHELASSRGDA